LKLIEELKAILASEERILGIIKDELNEIREKYGDGRRTEIQDVEEEDIEIEDMIEPEEMVVTRTHAGYIKRIGLDTYKQQRRGGRGVMGTGTKEEDFVENVFVANTHSYLLFFSDKGKVYWKKVHQVPEGSRQSKGKAIVNLVELGKDEKITATIPVKEFNHGQFLVMATEKGIVKKTELRAYSRPRAGGIIAISLNPGDNLVNVLITDGKEQLLVATANGQAVKFNEKDVRAVGRTSIGVRGIKLKGDDKVVGMVKADDNETLFTVTENGYGKRTRISDYRLINRGGSGVRNIIRSERNGRVIAIKEVEDNDQIMMMSMNGITIRMPVLGVNVIGRNTQGVRVMRLDQGDKVTGAAKIIGEAEEEKEIEKEEKEEAEKVVETKEVMEDLSSEEFKEEEQAEEDVGNIVIKEIEDPDDIYKEEE
jgi:DNA gyrase subunit A